MAVKQMLIIAKQTTYFSPGLSVGRLSSPSFANIYQCNYGLAHLLPIESIKKTNRVNKLPEEKRGTSLLAKNVRFKLGLLTEAVG